ncbi:hypothetical protein EOD42_05695 [Rhodovarius crocodyli]|uniref:Lipoprotein n=1 Tax=Rhodovarius crocodyli TaxID=1979269 RepID=A0A437MPK4_9PROT|nr:hypothetical protein [Rhodovarius crocodyli]RVT99573.1 hypothetical protein EOD42_05695 [Rhodovarius crocodyli]
MRNSLLAAFAACGLMVACAPNPADNFVSSNRSAVEMRAMQSRLFDGSSDQVARGVVSTFHDLGYRIIRVDSASGTVSAARMGRLRMSAVVRSQAAGRSAVRVNAAVLMPDGKMYEVDAPEFYQANFFVPMTQLMGREAFAISATDAVPDAVRPESDRPTTNNLPTGAAR